MSSTIDDRIVKLQFDSAAFEAGAAKAISILEKLEGALKLDGATLGIGKVKDSIQSLNMDSVSESVEECSNHFSLFERFVNGTIDRLASKFTDFGLGIAKKALIDPVMDGLHEYETQIGSVQTILSNAGDKLKAQGFTTQEAQIDKINASLDELNTYADKTIYNFTEMTRNIGTFTAAGVDLDTATRSIQGIANLAAASGSSSQQASTAMYQLSQAIAAGSLKLQDWNSVVNAGMGGELFQNALKRTARAHGVAVDEMIEKNGSFRESLQEGWISSEILTETLEQLTMSTEGLTEAQVEKMKTSLTDKGYTEEDAEAILELANNAQEAATKVRTWSQLWDTVGEALGSGWATTWRTIIGDFLEATEVFTWFSNSLTRMISASADARNEVLRQWSEANGGAGRKALIDSVKNLYTMIARPFRAIARAFASVFGVGAEQLYNFTTGLGVFTSKLVISKHQAGLLKKLFIDVFRIVHSFIGVVVNVGKTIFNVLSAVWTFVKPIVSEVFGVVAIIVKGLAWISEGIAALSGVIEQASYDIFVSALASIHDVLVSIFDSIKSNEKVASFIKTFTENFETFKTAVSQAADYIRRFFDIFFQHKKVITKSGQEISLASPFEKAFIWPMQKAIDSIGDFVTGFIEAKDKIKYVAGSIASGLSSAKDAFSNFYDTVSSPKNIYDKFEVLDSNIVDFIYSAIPDRGVADKVYEAYANVANPIFDFFHKTIADAKTWGEAFENTKVVLKDAIKNGFSKLPKPVQTAGKALYRFGSDIFSQVKNWFVSTEAFKKFSDLFSKVSGYLPDYLKDWDAFKDKVSEVFDKVVNYLENVDTSKLLDDLTRPFKVALKPIETFINTWSFLKDTGFSVADMLGKSDMGSSLSGIFGSLTGSVSSLAPGASNLLSQTAGSLTYGFDKIKDEAGKLSFSNIIDNFNAFVDFITSIPDKIRTGLDNIVNNVTNFFKEFPWPSFDQIKEVGGIIGKFVAGKTIRDFIKSLTGLNDTFSGLGKGIIDWPTKFGDALGKFGEGFNSWKKETKADAFVKIAKGILILAGALFVIASIPTEDLIKAGKAMAIMGGSIAAFFVIFGLLDKYKVIDSGAIQNLGSAIEGIGIGVLAMSAACLILSQVPTDDIAQGLAGCFVLIVACAAFAKGMGQNGKSMLAGSIGMIAFAIALGKMADVVAELGKMDTTQLIKGVAAFSVIILVLTAFGHFAAKEIGQLLSSLLKFGAGILLMAVGFGVLAGSMLALGLVLSRMSNLPAVIGVMVGTLVAFVAVCLLVKKADPVAAGLGLIEFAAALAIMAAALYFLSTVDLTSLLVSFGTLAAFLGIFAAISYLIDPEKTEATSKAILIFSAALAVMSISLIALSMVPWQALLTGAAVLAIFLIGFAAMAATLDPDKTMTISQAIIIFSAALMVMVVAFIALQAVNIDQIVPGLVAICAIFLGFAVVAGILSGMADKVLILSAAFLIFAIAVNLIVDALINLQNGIDWEGIGNSISNFLDSVKEFGENIINGITEGVHSALDTMGNIASDIFHAITDPVLSLFGIQSPSTYMRDQVGANIVQGIIDGITGFLGPLKDGAGNIFNTITGAITGLPEWLSNTASSGGGGFVSTLAGFAGSAGGAITDVVGNVLSGAQGLTSGLSKEASSGGDSIVSGLSSKSGAVKGSVTKYVTSAKATVAKLAPEMRSAGAKSGTALATGLSSASPKVISAVNKLNTSARAAARRGSLVDAGRYLAEGMAIGISRNAYKAINAAVDMVSRAISRAKAKAREASPSKAFIEIGAYMSEGAAIGIRDKAPLAEAASGDMAESAINAFSDTLGAMSIDIDDLLETEYNPVITPVIDPTQFNYSLNSLSNMMNTGLSSNLMVGNLNYSGEIVGKFDEFTDMNKQAMEQIASNAIDYDLLGVSVANALIRSGVHVEMDGGQVVGYIAGEVRNARRSYGIV